jgi:hypothetical protein
MSDAKKINPASLTVEELAALLTAAGGKKIEPATVRKHLERGAPQAADGRINLVHYGAWLKRELSSKK